MHYLAFDVSKNKLDCVLTNLRAKTEYFKIDNDIQSINILLDNLNSPKKVVFGCESTGEYHCLLMKTAVEKGLTFKLLNPLLVKQFTRTTIRKRKTDKTDSLIIAKLLAQGEGSMITEKDLDLTAKIMQRGLGKLTEEKHKFSLMRQRLINKEKNESMLFLDNRFKEIEDKISTALKEQFSFIREMYSKEPVLKLLESIPGIGFRLAFVVWTEIRDISKFKGPEKLIAFAGLDPKIRQSGHCLNSQGKITKRGSPHLRRALFLAANVARRFDPELKAYYEKKIAEGKRFTVANCSVARKIVNRIYAVWERKTPYLKREFFNANIQRKVVESAIY